MFGMLSTAYSSRPLGLCLNATAIIYYYIFMLDRLKTTIIYGLSGRVALALFSVGLLYDPILILAVENSSFPQTVHKSCTSYTSVKQQY